MKFIFKNNFFKDIYYNFNHAKREKVVFIVALLSLAFILLMTLYPLRFSYPDAFSIVSVHQHFNNPSNIYDFILNIFLFMPFGLSLTYLLSSGKRRWLSLVIVLLGSFSLSLTVEVIQIFLPTRSSTVADLFSNSLGGLLGSFSFYSPRLKKFMSLRRLVACFILYSTITFLFSIPLPSRSYLKDWNPSFPLVLGNEKTGDRPWQGSISELYIADQAITKNEAIKVLGPQAYSKYLSNKAIAYYQLSGREEYQDQIKKSPSLRWQGEQPDCQENCSLLLSSQHWLSTEGPASFITERIRETSQFSLITNISTSDSNQTGPARIISLSDSPYQRNFSLGQEGSNLVFRIRTPITGNNGLQPELMIPGVFSDKNTHLIVITYASSLLQVFIDRVENYFYLELIPGKSALLQIFPGETDDNLFVYALVYYSVVFAPLGLILSLITNFHREKVGSVLLLMAIGVLVPVLLLEIILASGTGRGMSLNNILLSTVIMTTAMLLVRGQLSVMRSVKKMFSSG